MKWPEIEAACEEMIAGRLEPQEWIELVGRLGKRHACILIAYLTGCVHSREESLKNFRELLQRPVSCTHGFHPIDLVRARPR